MATSGPTSSSPPSETRGRSELPEPVSGTDSVQLIDSKQELQDETQDAENIKTTTDDLFYEETTEAYHQPMERNSGLHVYSPEGQSRSDNDDYDVITVHGIRDDYKTAWSDKNGVRWVRKQMFKGLSVREIDYSYHIDEKSTLYQPDGIMMHSKRLMDKYVEFRNELEETNTYRPVIWICHDLGGTIVKEALWLASSNPTKYGKISFLTTALIFLETPHRFSTRDDLKNHLERLISLPGPDIRDWISLRVERLANQVDRANQHFLATKFLQRAVVFNVFRYNLYDSSRKGDGSSTAAGVDGSESIREENKLNSATSFSQWRYIFGNAFEGKVRVCGPDNTHIDLVMSEPSNGWFPGIFDIPGKTVKVGYRVIRLQTWLLSLAPPMRLPDVLFDCELSDPPLVGWMREQEPFIAFQKHGAGQRLLHLHGSGNQSIDISQISRLFYAAYVSTPAAHDERNPKPTVLYFEFDQRDSKYCSLTSMLTCFINVLFWRYWDVVGKTMIEELAFLEATRAWTLEDLYHLYSTLRTCFKSIRELIIFIGCFDQCPETQQRWFMERVFQELSYSEAPYRMILSSSAPQSISYENFPNEGRVSLDGCPNITKVRCNSSEELRQGLDGLIAARQIYKEFRPQLEKILLEQSKSPELGHIVIRYLMHRDRGTPKAKIEDIITQLSTITPINLFHVVTSLLDDRLKARAKNIFNWIKHAAEPWTSGALIEALALCDFPEEDPSLNDLDKECQIIEAEEMLSGFITIQDGDVKFSHPSFYLESEVGVEGSDEEKAATVHASLAKISLRYFQIKSAQEELALFVSERLEGGPWETALDAVVCTHPRVTMAEYAIRFWSYHYKASGRFKPTEHVKELFNNRQARESWEVSFWLLSNPFTRIQQSYITLLPVYAMLGLEDLVDDYLNSETGKPFFEKDCWLAITEAARAGDKLMVEKILDKVTVYEGELQTTLFWATAQGNTGVLDILLGKIPNKETFQWPVNAMPRATAIGHERLLAVILRSGCNINKTCDYWRATPAIISTYWDHSDPAQSAPIKSSPAQLDPTHSDPARFALLVGINKYHNDIEDPPFHNLLGCLKDVQIVKEYLKDQYRTIEAVLMTSPPTSNNSPLELLPSEKNIRAQFEKVLEKSKPGDLFYFHFSGHGTRLPSSKGSPNHPNDDPSLVTVDFDSGYSAIRGWELNKLLERFDEKGVHVLVTLDSCYSGNAWRNRDKTVRSIDPPGMSDDIEALKEKAQPDSELRGNRDAAQQYDWSINPEHLALMTACGPNEEAHESSEEGGLFTHALLMYLKYLGHPATYTMAGAHVKQQLQKINQTPGVYGRNKLQFFEHYVPFIAEPIVAHFNQEKSTVTVSAGTAHGITKGTEFRSYSLRPEVEFAVEDVKAYTSSAKLKAQDFVSLQRVESAAVIPLRWCFNDKVEITVGDGFPANFSKDLEKCLEKEIASPITDQRAESTAKHLSFNLYRETIDGMNLIQLKGPEDTVGYPNPIRPLQLHKVRSYYLKRAVAKVIAHLARFKQILDIKGNTRETPPFTVERKHIPEDQQEPDSGRQSYELVFVNTSKYDLFVTILNLTPGFGIGRLELDASENCHVPPREQKKVAFTMVRPTDPEWVAKTSDHDYRDIIRACVSQEDSVSWTVLEMPDIWEDFETSETQKRPAVDGKGPHVTGRDRPKWWIHDCEISS